MTEQRDTTEAFGSIGWWDKELLGKNVWEAAVERCIYTMETFEDFVVSFSGGKDSTAVLQAVLEAHSVLGRTEPVKVFYLDDEIVAQQTDEYILRCMESMPIDLHWYCVPVKQRNSCSMTQPIWYPWGEEVRHLWCREMPEQTTHTADNLPWFPNATPDDRPTLAGISPYLIHGWDPDAPGRKRVAMFLGIRAAESMMRRMAIARHRDDPDHWMTHLGRSDKSLAWYSKVYPIFDWSETDVWSAPRIFDWDYNRVYDAFEMLGLPPSAQRIGTPFGEEPSRSLWVWHRVFPELWDKMVDRVPGVQAAYRLSNTALYGKGEAGATGRADVLPPLAEGQTYRDLLRETIMQYEDPVIRAEIASRAQMMLNRHARKTSDPLVVFAAHPISGFSWLEVIRFATLGDLKSRRTIKKPNNAQQERARAEYEEERARLLMSGGLDACL